jgi:hypothetical protein
MVYSTIFPPCRSQQAATTFMGPMCTAAGQGFPACRYAGLAPVRKVSGGHEDRRTALEASPNRAAPEPKGSSTHHYGKPA